MKRKEAIKQIQEGKIQVFNDLLPSTEEIKKFLKEAFPEDDYLDKNPKKTRVLKGEYYTSDGDNKWYHHTSAKYLPTIKLSTITKRKKSKLNQLEKQFTELAKNVVELRQTLAKDVEVHVEEVKKELIVGEWYFYKENLLVYNNDKTTYGFWDINFRDNLLFNKSSFGVNSIKATPQEVQTALENEAKKRGFVEGVKIEELLKYNFGTNKKGFEKTEVSDEDYIFDKENNLLFIGNLMIFNNGIWAEIQQETIKEEEIDFSVPQFLIHEDGQVLLSTGYCRNNMSEATVIISSAAFKKGDKRMFRQNAFKKFKGELTIK